MEKKLQVFISSTFTDLREERQAAVEAILSAGHIPAGMELFAAGNESQLDTVKRWIQQSDVYLLILGGRYGSLEPRTKKSYTHVEYEYALERKIPLFAVVITNEALQTKVKDHGTAVIDLEYREEYEAFRRLVTSKTCRFFGDSKDIKLAVHETLADFQRRFPLSGWVSGKHVAKVETLEKENAKLLKENTTLVNKLAKLVAEKKNLLGDEQYLSIKNALRKIEVKLPAYTANKTKEKAVDLLTVYVAVKDKLAIGVTNRASASKHEAFIFYEVASKLMTFGLVEKARVPSSVYWDKVQTSRLGHEFLRAVLAEEEEATNS